MAKKVNTSQMMKNGKNHGNFRKKNEEVRSMKNRCEKCDFLGKTPAGLKTHVRKETLSLL